MVDTVVSKSLIQRTPVNTTTGAVSPIDSDLVTMQGTVTLNGTTPVTVANTNITANSVIVVTLKTVGGTVGAAPVVDTITAGTGFTIKGTASDTSVYNYRVLG
jgi:hypothetical protein